jgi:putative heme-binding domain-containing protein
VKSVGNLMQTVPRAKIESITKLDKSLMLQPSQMGLTAETIADIVAYLKSL